MEELLKELSSKDSFILALLSDTTPIHNAIRDKQGYYKYFKKAFLSFEIGYCKPDPRTYQMVIDYFEVLPDQIFFVDDNPKNVEAARQAGIISEVFTTPESLKNSLRELGVNID